ncbi:hypothetical protein [Acanthopleuribacter pedis]|uniref:Uncharacterized protein n=1 Tax=Acanthopleuribacter pedis TaxID=442870 RepID=A0A8J7QB06_9BACT|nr:hypothetical protein [Acanthopleuribacter pedis]MBO1320344.1 hypothetical protein [Acanthopleuribacter pedis]
MRHFFAISFLLLTSVVFSQEVVPDEALARTRFIFEAAGLRVTPESATVLLDPEGLPVTFQLVSDQPLPPSGSFVGEWVTPGQGDVLTLQVPVAEARFIIPRSQLPRAGLYQLRNIRLVQGDTVVGFATPRAVRVEVVDDFVVAEAEVRPLTEAELAERGFLFNEDDYQAFSFSFALEIGGPTREQVTIDAVFPRAHTYMELPPGRTISDPFTQSPLKVLFPQARGGGGFRVPEPLLRGGIERPSFTPSMVIMPGGYSYLKSFFEVKALVLNRAPAGFQVTLENLLARVELPNPDRFGLPLQLRDDGIQDMVNPGPDGDLNTADDPREVSPGEEAQAAFIVRAEREGSYPISLELQGDVVLGGERTEMRTAADTFVHVRAPDYLLTFDHPERVSEDTPYDLVARLTNQSNVPLSGFRITLPPESLYGCRLVDGNPTQSFPELAPDASAEVVYRLRATRPGVVEAGYYRVREDAPGSMQLRVAVGNSDVVAPTSLVFPNSFQVFPADLRTALRLATQQAYDLSHLDPSGLPAGQDPIGWSAAQALAKAYAVHGFSRSAGASEAESLVRLLATWVRGGNNPLPLDQLRRRRLTQNSDPLEQLFARELQRLFSETNTSGFRALRAIALENEECSEQFGVVIHSDQPITFQLRNADGGVLDNAGVRTFPFGTVLPLSERVFLVWVAKIDELPSLQLTTSAATNITIGGVFPRNGARDLFTFEAGPIGLARSAQFTWDGDNGEVTLQRDSNPPVILEGVRLPTKPFTLRRVAQVSDENLGDSGDPFGRAVLFHFSKALDLSTLVPLREQIRINGTRVSSVELQPDRRTLVVGTRFPIGPYRANSYRLEGIRAYQGENSGVLEGTFQGSNRFTGIRVSGRVLDGNREDFSDGMVAYGLVPTEREVIVREDEEPNFSFPIMGKMKQQFTVPMAADGSFDIDFLPFSSFSSDTPKQFYMIAMLPDGRRRSEQFTMRGEGQHFQIDMVFSAQGTVVGRVFENNQPAAFVTVFADNPEVLNSGVRGQTDANGFYRLEGLPVGPILIKAGGQGRLGLASTFLTEANSPQTRDINITSVSATISGRITAQTEDGRIVPLAEIPVYHAALGVPTANAHGIPYNSLAFTDQNGFYLMEDAVAGAGQIAVDPMDGRTARLQIPFNPQPGENTFDYTFAYQSPPNYTGTVRGRVRDADGRGRQYGVQLNGGSIRGPTDASGRFEFTFLPLNSSQTINFYPLQEGTGPTFLRRIRLTESEPTLDLEISLPRERTISGTLVNAAGEPIPFVPLYAPTHFGGDQVTRSDAEGRWQFQVTEPGRYQITAGTHPRIAEAMVSIADNNVLDVELRTLAQGSVTIRLVDADGQAVMGRIEIDSNRPSTATATFGIGSFGFSHSLYTDTDGHVQIDDINYGLFEVRGFHPLLGQTQRFSGQMNTPDHADLVLSFPPNNSYDLFGTVVSADGAPAANMLVQLQYNAEGRRQRRTVRTNAEGNYSFGTLLQDITGATTTLIAYDPDSGDFETAQVDVRDGVRFRQDFQLKKAATLLVAVQFADGAPAEFANLAARFDTLTSTEVPEEEHPALNFEAMGNPALVSGYSVVREQTGAGLFRISGVRTGPVVLHAVTGNGLVAQRRLLLNGDHDEIPITLTLEPESSIRGTFVDGASAPIPGGEVQVRQGDALLQQRATGRDENDLGRFSFQLMPMGAYRLRGRNPSNAFIAELDVVTSPFQPEADVVLATAPVADIGGLVLSDGEAVPGARLWIDDGSSRGKMTGTDAAGAYLFRNLRAGTYPISVVDLSGGRVGRIEVVHDPRQGATSADIHLSPGINLTLAIQESNGEPVTNLPVSLVVEQEDRSVLVAPGAGGVSDVVGLVRLTAVPAGIYQVNATHPDGRRLIQQIVVDDSLDPETPVLVAFPGYGEVRGQVLQADGTPFTQTLSVYLQRGLDRYGNFERATRTFNNGDFSFTRVPLGEPWVVAAYHPETNGIAAFSFQINTPGEVVETDLQMAPTTFISGTIYLPDGSPAPFAKVNMEGPPLRSFISDGGGNFFIEPVLAGPEQLIVFESAGLELGLVDIEITTDDAGVPQPLTNLRIDLNGLSFLNGTIRYSDGSPVQQGQLYYRPENGRGKSVATDAGGNFSIPVLSNTDYILRAFDNATKHYMEEVPFRASAANARDQIELRFPADLTFSGRVLGPDGFTPAAGATLELYRRVRLPGALAASSYLSVRTESDGGGAFSVNRIFPGDYLLRAYTANYEALIEQSITFTENMDREIRLAATATILGRVRDGNGRIFDSGQIFVQPDLVNTRIPIGSDGSFIIDRLPVTTVTLTAVVANATLRVPREVVLVPGVNLVDMILPNTIEVTGTGVVTDANPGIASARLELDNGSFSTVLPNTGRFAFPRVIANRPFEVVISSGGGWRSYTYEGFTADTELGDLHVDPSPPELNLTMPSLNVTQLPLEITFSARDSTPFSGIDPSRSRVSINGRDLSGAFHFDENGGRALLTRLPDGITRGANEMLIEVANTSRLATRATFALQVDVSDRVLLVTLRDGVLPVVGNLQMPDGTLYTADSEGRVAVSDLPPGDYAVTAWNPEGTRGLRATVSVGAPSRTEITLNMVPVGEYVGRVLDLQGNPAAGIPVTWREYQVVSDENGGYRFPVMALGQSFDLIARAGQTIGHTATAALDLAGAAAVADIQLEGLGRVEGLVRQASDDSLVAGARVSLEGDDLPRALHQTITSDAEGAFSFESVMLRAYTLTAEHPETGLGGTASGRLTQVGQTDSQTIRLEPTGTVTGVAVFASQAAAGAVVEVTGPRDRTLTTDENGGFSLADLPYGDYDFSIEDRARFAYRTGTFSLNREQLALGDLELSADNPPQINAFSLSQNQYDPLETPRIQFELADDRGIQAWRINLTGAIERSWSSSPRENPLTLSDTYFVRNEEPEPGEVQVQFEVEDGLGQITTQSTTFTVALDATPPQIALLSHDDGAVVLESDRVDLRFDISDNLAVNQVALYVNNSLYVEGTSRNTPILWSPPDINQPTDFAMRFEAADIRGNRGVLPFTLRVEPVNSEGAPELTITAPADAMPLPLFLPEGLVIPVRADVRDPDGLGTWRVLVDGILQESGTFAEGQTTLAVDISVPAEWRDREQLTLRVEATDRGGILAVQQHTVVAAGGEVFTDLVIAAENRDYEDRALILLGNNNRIEGAHRFASLTLVNGAVVSQGAAGSVAAAPTELELSGDLVVDARSRIDMSGRGYSEGPPNLFTHTGNAAYAGLGNGDDPGDSSQIYGSPIRPNQAGSNNGGGFLRLRGARIWLDGAIHADGGQTPSGTSRYGSGGALDLEAGQWLGLGRITANGFDSNNPETHDNGGSGGRIAIRGAFAGQVQAYGARNCGHGTLYLQTPDTNLPDGTLDRLVVNGPNIGNRDSNNLTWLPGLGDLLVGTHVRIREEQVDNAVHQVLTVTVTDTVNGANRAYNLNQGAFEGLHVISQGQPSVPVWRQNGNELWSPPDQPFATFTEGDRVDVVMALDRIEIGGKALVRVRGNPAFPLNAGEAWIGNEFGRWDLRAGFARQAPVELTGNLRFADVRVNGPNGLTLNGDLIFDSLTFEDGTHILGGSLQGDLLRIEAGAVVTTPSGTSARLRVVVREATIAGELGTLGATHPYPTGDPRFPHHGGLAAGAQPGDQTHGSLYQPTSTGASGTLYIEAAEQLTVEGSLHADNSGDAAGSLWLETAALTGNGRISADSVGGVAGRIAVYADSVTGFGGAVQARSTRQGAGAGTVFYRTNTWPLGKLVVDNGDLATPAGSTPLPGIGARTLETPVDGTALTLLAGDPTPFPDNLAGMYLETEGEPPALIAANDALRLEPADRFPTLSVGTGYRGLHRFNVVELRNGSIASPDRIEITDELILAGGSLDAAQVDYPPGFALRDGALEIFEDLGIPDLVLDNFTLTSHVPLQLDSLTLRNGAHLIYHQPMSAGTVSLDNGRLSAAIVDRDAVFAAESVSLSNGSLWAAAPLGDNGTRFALRAEVNGAVIVDASSRISTGEPGSHAPTYREWNGTRWAVSSHGGSGRLLGNRNNPRTAQPVFGSFKQPVDDGGYNGGGALFLRAASLELAGALRAEGGDSGAGGSIWLQIPVITGNGLISVAGNNGGGGRIAVEYSSARTFLDSLQFQLGGDSPSEPFEANGAGTLFVKSAAQNHGELLVDQQLSANPETYTQRRRLTGLGGIDRLTLPATDNDTDNPRRLNLPGGLLPPDLVGLTLQLGSAEGAPRYNVTDSGPDFIELDRDLNKPIAAGTELTFAVFLDRLILRNGAQLQVPGVLHCDELLLEGSAVTSLWARDWVLSTNTFRLNNRLFRLILDEPTWSQRDLVLDGATLFLDRPLECNDLTLVNATISHSHHDHHYAPYQPVVDIIARTVDGSGLSAIQVSSSVSVPGSGYDGHGGVRNEAGTRTYGSPLYPDQLGIGSAAGGALRLRADSLRGVALRADGNNGSGGSIWVTVDHWQNEGVAISATGGLGGRFTGSGGRVALRYRTLSGASPTAVAHGSFSAGTVLIQHLETEPYGTLFIDNNSGAANQRTPLPGFPRTTLPAGFSQTFDADRNRTTLLVPNLVLEEHFRDYVLIANENSGSAARILEASNEQNSARFLIDGPLTFLQPGDRIQPGLRINRLTISPNCVGCIVGGSDVLLLAQPRLEQLTVAPLNGGRVAPGQPFTVTASAVGNARLVSAEAVFNGETQLQTGAGPYQFAFIAPVPEGDSDLPAVLRFTDADGNVGEHNFMIGVSGPDRQAPEVVVLEPSEGLDIFPGGILSVTVQARDNRLLESISATFNGETQRNEIPSETQETQTSFSFTIPSLGANQTMTLEVSARDDSGNQGQTQVSLNYLNEDRAGPNVHIVGPRSLYAHTGEGLTVEVAADDPSGINQVSIRYDGETRTVTTPPYTASFLIDTPVAEQSVTETISVTAEDNLGNQTSRDFVLTLLPLNEPVLFLGQSYPDTGEPVTAFETIPLQLAVYSLFEDFENGPGTWRDEDPTGGDWRPWAENTDAPLRGNRSRRLQGDRVNGETRLVTPFFFVPARSSVRLEFVHSGNLNSRRDGIIVEKRIAGSDTWLPLYIRGPAYVRTISDRDSALYNQYAYTGSFSPGLARVGLYDTSEQIVQVAWRYVGNDTLDNDNRYSIDDVRLVCEDGCGLTSVQLDNGLTPPQTFDLDTTWLTYQFPSTLTTTSLSIEAVGETATGRQYPGVLSFQLSPDTVPPLVQVTEPPRFAPVTAANPVPVTVSASDIAPIHGFPSIEPPFWSTQTVRGPSEYQWERQEAVASISGSAGTESLRAELTLGPYQMPDSGSRFSFSSEFQNDNFDQRDLAGGFILLSRDNGATWETAEPFLPGDFYSGPYAGNDPAENGTPVVFDYASGDFTMDLDGFDGAALLVKFVLLNSGQNSATWRIRNLMQSGMKRVQGSGVNEIQLNLGDSQATLQETPYQASLTAPASASITQVPIQVSATDGRGNTTRIEHPILTVPTDVVRGEALTLAADDTSYEGRNLMLSAGNHVIDGSHRFASLYLLPGAVLTQTPSPDNTQPALTDLTIDGTLYVFEGARIDVSGAGYPRDTTHPDTGLAAGHGYGGTGAGETGGTYGNLFQPNEVGSATGGGRLRIQAQNMHLDGELAADGRVYQGRYGSGGSIAVTLSEGLSGNGRIQADGTNGSDLSMPGGGGGRIAVRARSISEFTGAWSVGGGLQAGTGTIFVDADGQQRVWLQGTPQDQPGQTDLSGIGTNPPDVLRAVASRFRLDSDLAATRLELAQSWVTFAEELGQVDLRGRTQAHQSRFIGSFFIGNDLVSPGNRPDREVEFFGTVTAGNLNIDRDTGFAGTLRADTLNLAEGSQATRLYVPVDLENEPLSIEVSNSVQLAFNTFIEALNGAGVDGNRVSHGGLAAGLAAGDAGTPYGNLYRPNTPGGMGGVIHLRAASLYLDGTIRVGLGQEYNGAFPYFFGSGGSLLVEVDRIEGYSGMLNASGAFSYLDAIPDFAPSGGRIALHVAQPDGDQFFGQLLAHGATVGRNITFEMLGKGAPGTIYRRNSNYANGHLLIRDEAYWLDDGSIATAPTPMVSLGARTASVADSDGDTRWQDPGHSFPAALAGRQLVHQEVALGIITDNDADSITLDQPLPTVNAGDTLIGRHNLSALTIAWDVTSLDEVVPQAYTLEGGRFTAPNFTPPSGKTLANQSIRHTQLREDNPLILRGTVMQVEGDAVLQNLVLEEGAVLEVGARGDGTQPTLIANRIVLRKGSRLAADHIRVAGSVSVEAGAVIEGANRHERFQWPAGRTWERPRRADSYGGAAADERPGRTFGSPCRPDAPGGGRKAVRLTCATLQLDGRLMSSANPAQLGNGAVWLETNVLSGSGGIHADADGRAAELGQGGGRIVIHAARLDRWQGDVTAYGSPADPANNRPEAGAGTILIKGPDAPNGRLVIQGREDAGRTPLLGTGAFQLAQDDSDGDHLLTPGIALPPGLTGAVLHIQLGNQQLEVPVLGHDHQTLRLAWPLPPLPAGTNIKPHWHLDSLTLAGGAELSTPDGIVIHRHFEVTARTQAPALLEAASLKLPNNLWSLGGALELRVADGLAETEIVLEPGAELILAPDVALGGLSVAEGALVRLPEDDGGVVPQWGNLILHGGIHRYARLRTNGRIYLNSAVLEVDQLLQARALILNRGARVTQPPRDVTRPYPTLINLTESLEVSADSLLDFDGVGLRQDPSDAGFSASHAGPASDEGDFTPRGALFQPSQPGGGIAGGGAVHIAAPALRLDGMLRARGIGFSAGGSLLVRVRELSGNGLIDVSGGRDRNRFGGGGRIALTLQSAHRFGGRITTGPAPHHGSLLWEQTGSRRVLVDYGGPPQATPPPVHTAPALLLTPDILKPVGQTHVALVTQDLRDYVGMWLRAENNSVRLLAVEPADDRQWRLTLSAPIDASPHTVIILAEEPVATLPSQVPVVLP